MARENIRFNGINRNSNVSDSKVGDCEELINVRSENGALKIVKDHVEISSNIPYRDIIIHDVFGVRNFIGKDSSGWVWFDPATGLLFKRLYDKVENTHIAKLNNQIIISDISNITNVVYLYTNSSYELINTHANFDLNYTLYHTRIGPDVEEYILSPTKEEYLSSCRSIINKFKIENETACEGIFLMAFSITLYDGTETGMYGLRAASSEALANGSAANAFIDIGNTDSNSGVASQIVTKFNFVKFYESFIVETKKNEALYKELNKTIKSINLYVSKPITKLPLEEGYVEIKDVTFNNSSSIVTVGSNPQFIISTREADSTGIEKTLLYKQKSWDFSEFCEGISYNLVFGGDKQATGKTMEVSTSYLNRAGKMLVYNNRIHFFNSMVQMNMPVGHLYEALYVDYLTVSANIYVYLKINGNDKVIKYSDVTLARGENSTSTSYPTLILPEMLTYSDSRAYKMLIIVNDSTLVEGYSKFQLTMDFLSSPAYNYSYSFSKKVSLELIPSDLDEESIILDSSYTENNTVNVTTQNNSLVFSVEHSYLFDGDVKSLSYATEPISQTQVGQYPLYVFTNKGIYAMEQGTGAVLYANQIMINTDKCSHDVVQTRNGVVYIANNSIYILSGRNSLNISLPVDGPIDTDIRRAEAYPMCCMSDSLYNVEHNVSQIELKEYLEDVNMVYIPYRDELIVSNPDYKYSYVFSFIYKTWHKVTDSFESVGDNIIRRAVSQSSSVAKAAQGKIIVASAVITPAHTFSAVQQAIYSGVDFISGTNERYALVVDGVQVSSALFRYPTKLPLMLAILCKDIPYLDCWYDGSSHFILTDLAFETGAQLELVQLSNSYKIFQVPFSDYQTVVSIPDKAIGSNVSVSSSNGGTASTRAIKESDTVLTIAAGLNSAINASANMGFLSELGVNELSLTAETAGAAGNDIEISFNTGDYVNIFCTELAGGKNISLEPGNYGVMEDHTKEKHGSKTIHLQSRPMSFSDAFTLVRRMIFHCKASLAAEKNLSLYLFASNDLHSWQCVAAAQRGNTEIDHIRLQRSGRAYKYYVVIIGGQVYTTTELSYIMMEVEERFSSKIR